MASQTAARVVAPTVAQQYLHAISRRFVGFLRTSNSPSLSQVIPIALVVSVLTVTQSFSQPPPEVAVVCGVVTDAKTKQPLEGAIVTLRAPNKEGAFVKVYPIPGMNATTTDAKGGFRFEGIPEGEYQLTVSASYYQSFVQKITVVKENPPAVAAVLTPLNVLLGTVFRPDGAPLAKVNVYLSVERGGNTRQTYFQTDAQGRYRLPYTVVGRHRALVRVPKAGWVYTEFTPKSGEDCTVDFRLEPAASISGKVRDKATEKPVTGIHVTATPAAQAGAPTLPSPYPEITRTTDVEGRFVLSDVPAGPWLVQVSGVTLLSSTSARVVLQPGQRHEDVSLAISIAPVVKGVLTGITGQPLTTMQGANLEICTRQQDGSYSIVAETVSVDAGGGITVIIRQVGEIRLRVFVDEEGWGVSEWMKVEQGKTVDVVIPLRPLHRLAGTVREKGTGNPIAGAVVKVEPVTTGEPPVARIIDATCDNEGRFVLKNVTPANYTITATCEGFVSPQPQHILVREGETPLERVIEMTRASTDKTNL